jgi:hypothetical protein
MTVNSELEGMWKEAVLAYIKLLSQLFAGETKENCNKSRLNRCSLVAVLLNM